MSPRDQSNQSQTHFRIKTLQKFLHLYNVARDRGRSLEAREIAELIGCCRGHAYSYKKPLDMLLRTQLVI